MVISGLHVGAASSAEASEVPWSSLTLQAARLGSTATVEVTLDELPTAAETQRFIDSPQGTPISASGSELQRLNVVTTLKILGGRQVRLENQLWFDPLTRTPLYLVRKRFGLKDYYQCFRFTREGVFRRQSEPASAVEIEAPPQSWTKRGEHFYPFPSDSQSCSLIVETSMLIVLAGERGSAAPATREPLCVFHKRQVHRVRVYQQPAQKVSFDYLERRAGKVARHTGAVLALGMFIESHPIGSYRGDVEDFFKDGSRFYLSPENQLPLIVSGELPLIGRVDLQLTDVQIR